MLTYLIFKSKYVKPKLNKIKLLLPKTLYFLKWISILSMYVHLFVFPSFTVNLVFTIIR
jgi:hypothetical protein